MQISPVPSSQLRSVSLGLPLKHRKKHFFRLISQTEPLVSLT
uniref:Uncharacterized protein n=1 Tax=Anguilla anguilla TaxID=7936 RepID=A0A0E9QUS6_ANGAN